MLYVLEIIGTKKNLGTNNLAGGVLTLFGRFILGCSFMPTKHLLCHAVRDFQQKHSFICLKNGIKIAM
jgi:hypothetical protein